jgi:hypothetical protein
MAALLGYDAKATAELCRVAFVGMSDFLDLVAFGR